METFRPGLIGMGLAAVVALLVSALGGRGPTWGRRALPIGLGLAYALGHAAVRGWLRRDWPPFPPLDATDWVPWLALGASLLGLLETVAPTPAWARWENRLLMTALTLWLVLGPLLGGAWEPREGYVRLAGLGLGMLAAWGVLDWQAERLGRATLLPLTLLAGGTAAGLLLSHSLVLAEFAAVLAASLAACWLVGLWSPGLTPARGGVAVVVVVLAGLLLAGHFYAYPELPGPVAATLAAAPLALWVDRLGPARRLGPWASSFLRLAAVGGVVGVALVILVLQAPPPGDDAMGATSTPTRTLAQREADA